MSEWQFFASCVAALVAMLTEYSSFVQVLQLWEGEEEEGGRMRSRSGGFRSIQGSMGRSLLVYNIHNIKCYQLHRHKLACMITTCT